jgi:hypothetical protein
VHHELEELLDQYLEISGLSPNEIDVLRLAL